MAAKKKKPAKKARKKETAYAKRKRLKLEATELARIERRTSVLRFAQAGLPRSEIARRLGVSLAVATKDLNEELDTLRAETQDEAARYRALSNSRLENAHRLLLAKLLPPTPLNGESGETPQQELNRTIRVIDALGRLHDRSARLNGLNHEEDAKDRNADAQEMANRILPILQKWLMVIDAPREIIEQMLREITAALLGEVVSAGTASVVVAGLQPRRGLTSDVAQPHNGASTNGHARTNGKKESDDESTNGNG